MRTIILIALLCTVLQQTFGYSKYGRSCKDIGCPSNEMCVMAEDPCSYYNRDQCGSYPTCKTSAGHSSPSCAAHICPPTQECQLDDGTPKCVPTKSSSTHVHKNENTGGASAPSYPSQNPSYPAQNPSYPAQNPSYPAQNPSYPAQNPSYPSQPAPSYPSGGGLYPSLTTARPSHGGSSYPGYPSQSGGGYPSQSGGYPSYPGGAPNSGYPSYPQQGYNNRGGYPSQGYPQYPAQSGYPGQGYPQYPGNQNNRQGYGSASQSNSGSNPIVDKITDQLKTIGLLCALLKFLTLRLTSI